MLFSLSAMNDIFVIAGGISVLLGLYMQFVGGVEKNKQKELKTKHDIEGIKSNLVEIKTSLNNLQKSDETQQDSSTSHELRLTRLETFVETFKESFTEFKAELREILKQTS